MKDRRIKREVNGVESVDLRPYKRLTPCRATEDQSDHQLKTPPAKLAFTKNTADSINALSPVVNLTRTTAVLRTPRQISNGSPSPMESFRIDKSFGNDSLLNESLFCALDDLERANLQNVDTKKLPHDSLLDVFEDSFDDRQLLDLPDHSTPKNDRLERSRLAAETAKAAPLDSHILPVNNIAPKEASTGLRKKKNSPKKKSKRKAKFKVAYTNRKNVQLLSESGGNELSREELSTLADEDKLLITSWGLPDSIVARYRFKGVTCLFPWQLNCLSNPKVFEGRNLLYSAPTSAGKTLVAEMLMLKRVLELGKKGIMILPFVSVAREKMYSLQDLYGDAGVRVEGFMGSYNPPGGFKSVDIAICTIEKANSLINRLLTEGTLFQVGTIVVDELHLVGDTHRGYLLELLLTKIKFMCGKQMPVVASRDSQEPPKNTTVNIQIIGMSATLPNLHLLAKWLDAELHMTDYRPVPLIETIKIGDKIYSSSLLELRNVHLETLPLNIQNDPDDVIYLSLETVLDGHSVLIFCPTKAWCEKLAEQIAREFYNIGRPNSDRPPEVGKRLRDQLNSSRIAEVLQQLNQCPAGKDEMLGITAAYGVAFHHAGLTYDERDILESGFKRGALRVIVATSTLSAGVNLPARRVIICSPVFNGQPLDPLTYKQMSGRAGRKGVDTEGESILICTAQNQDVGMNLIQSCLPTVRSALGGHAGALTSSMKRALLEVVASGIARSAEEVHKYTQSTLLSVAGDDEDGDSTSSQQEGKSIIEDCLDFLVENELIKLVKYEDAEKKDEFVATQLGLACLASSLSPDEGIAVFKELLRARQCFVLANELHVIYQVTPLYLSDQWRNLDWNHYLRLHSTLNPEELRVAQLVGVEERFIMNAMMSAVSWKNPAQRLKLSIHQRFYAALALNDLVNEMSIPSVADKYGVNKGVIQNLQQSASTFAGMVTVFCARLGWSNLELLLSQFQDRLEFGVQRELCDLVRLSYLNGQRARVLYNAGIQTIAELAACDPVEIEQIFLRTGQFSSNVHGNETGAKKIFVQGKTEGVSEEEAARLIVQEARHFLQDELGLGKLEFRPTSKLPLKRGTVEPLSANAVQEASILRDLEISPQKLSAHPVNSTYNKDGSSTPVHPESMECSSLNESSCPLAPCHELNMDIAADSKPGNNKAEEQTSLDSSVPKNNSETEYAESDVDLFENSAHLLEDRVEHNDGRESANLNWKEKPDNDGDMDEIGPTQDVHKEVSLMDMSFGSFRLSDDGMSPRKVSSTPQTMLKEADMKHASSSEDVFENSDSSPCGSLAESRIDIKQMLLKSSALRPLNTSSRAHSSSSDLFEDDDDTEVESTAPPSHFHVLHTKSRTVQARRIIIPDMLPKNYFTPGHPISMGITIKAPNRNESRPRFRIGAKILGKQMKSESRRDDSNIQYSLSLYNGGENVFFYESQLCTTSAVELRSVVETVLKKFVDTSCPMILLDTKLKLKNLIKYCGIDLLDGTFLPLEEIWDPKIGEWLCRGSGEETQFDDDETWVTTIQLMDSYLEDDEKEVQNTNWPSDAKETYAAWTVMNRLRRKLETLLLWNHFKEIEMASFLPITLMEVNGFAFNSAEFERLKKILKFQSAILELRAFQIVGRHFNLSSPKDINRVLFTELKLKRPPSTRGTGRDVLVKIDHAVAAIILEWRKVHHALQLILPFSQAQNLKTGRIHGVYSHFTTTGRIMMAEPSIQFVPRDFDLKISFSRAEVEALHAECAKFGSKVASHVSTVKEGLRMEGENFFSFENLESISMRNAFCASSPETCLIAADYSQLELRVLALLSKDQQLIQTLNSGKDVFKSIASQWKKIPVEEVDTPLRQEAKAIVYAIIYGMGQKSLGEKMGIDESKAADYIEQFMSAYPGIRNFRNSTVRSCREQGYVETFLGRRRFLPKINSREPALKAQAERQAVNYRVQGSASDLVKKAMIRAHMRISAFLKSMESASLSPPGMTSTSVRNRGVKVKPQAYQIVLNLHDELIFEVRKDVLSHVVAIIRDVMENPYALTVKLPVNIKVGRTWGSLTLLEPGKTCEFNFKY